MTNGTVLVASPSAIGRQPDASGSSVPAWPARLHLNSRLMAPTAWVEVMPTGLSSSTQPWTSCFSRRNCCGFALPCTGLSVPSPACGGGLGRGVNSKLGASEGHPPPASLRSATPPSRGEVTEFGARVTLLISALIALEVALYRRCSQKLLDPFRFVESFVSAETDFRSKF